MADSRFRFPALNGRNPRGGFALLLTLTLLAFVVLLLVGLATYTRVETAIAGNTQRQGQARENALLALNVALEQLQRNAGPDTRVTATAGSTAGVDAQRRRYTGVWDATATGTTALVWLASGAETSTGIDVATSVPAARRAVLIGAKTDGSSAANATVAELQDISVPGVPGQGSAATVIGRYAWWVGDQGVKAPVAVPDSIADITYAPYDSADLRNRLRQQLPLGAGAANANGEPVFEPRDANNAPLVAGNKVVAANQLALLRNAGNTPIALATLRTNFHNWSPNNFAVLANTKTGGLRQDLSLKPDLLGTAFASWADYESYMEKPQAPAEGAATLAAISPPYGSDALRRRFVMTPHLLDGGASHQVGPVLTYFLLTFNVRTENESTALAPLEVRARWMLSFWNPYSSALAPENLRVEVTGLPQSVRVVNDSIANPGPVGAPFSLAETFGSPLNINLPWDPAAPVGTPGEDRQSWLPGRVYTWRSQENITKTAVPPTTGYDSDFYSQSLNLAGKGVIRPLPFHSVDGDDDCHLEVNAPGPLRITLYAVRSTGDVRLGAFVSPDFVGDFSTAIQQAKQNGYQMSYVFRLAESLDTLSAPGTWLTTEMRDIRRRTVPPECFVVGENGDNPAQYPNYSTVLSPDRLLSRESGSHSYNEDVPVFELPRGPLLSLGALQHLRFVGRRPFIVGNPWGVSETLNNVRVGELFDRYFFSGLTANVVPDLTTGGDIVFPSPLLKPLRKDDGGKATVDELRALPDAHSSKFLLQAGAFNLNSTSATAWSAVLRSVRFPAPEAFRYLDASTATGTAADDDIATVQSGGAQFFRFSHSAQEVYKAEPGMAEKDPGTPSAANTHLFRRGMRTLDAAETAALAAKIVELMALKHSAADPLGGPFRSLDEFLSPSTLFEGLDPAGNTTGSRSLLEAAIADVGINAGIAEFSSQWLTQADIMTALAPVLFPRSDTFLIRTYGEAVNPVTQATEGRAWCEAIVQRTPEYLDPSQPAETAPAELNTLNAVHGRRFKIVSFRWLTRSDI